MAGVDKPLDAPCGDCMTNIATDGRWSPHCAHSGSCTWRTCNTCSWTFCAVLRRGMPDYLQDSGTT